MRPVPIWKVRRELYRVVLQIYDTLARPLRHATQYMYDSAFPQNLTITHGNAEIGKKVALLIIYQPNGLAKSTLLTCRHLLSIGYAPFVVSNGELSASDRGELTEVSALCVERPNYGYDFGGYRDGLRLMKLRGIAPETLIVMNDSIWFPVLPDGRMVATLEAEPSGFSGPVFEWRAHRGDKNIHYQSYFYVVQDAIFQHPAFQEYWRNYQLSSDKRLVLISGEKGLTQHLLKHSAIQKVKPTRTLMLERLALQDNACLHRILKYAAYETAELRDEALHLVRTHSDTADWHADVLAHMARALEKAQPMGTFPYAGLTIMGWDFLKKSSYPVIHDGMRWQYVRAVRNGDLPAPHPDVMAEILASPMDRSLTTDPSDPAPA